MAPMTKRVNVVTRIAVRNVTPPISGSYKNIVMSTSDILKLLCKRASVEEVLPDGRTVKLNMRNYYLDNGAGLDAYAGVNMDDKYNDNKDSKKSRGPLVHIPKKVTPPDKPEEQKQPTLEVVTELSGIIEHESPVTINLDIAIEDIEATEAKPDNIQEEENEIEEEVDTEESVEESTDETVVQPTNNTTSNSYHKKKKKKR